MIRPATHLRRLRDAMRPSKRVAGAGWSPEEACCRIVRGVAEARGDPVRRPDLRLLEVPRAELVERFAARTVI
jgi:hypothetical protein